MNDDELKKINKIIDRIKLNDYIKSLKRDIIRYNNQPEYFRLKYYDNMIQRINILREVLK